MKTLIKILPSFQDMKIQTMLMLLIIFFVIIAAVTGGAGFYFINDIDNAVGDLTEVSSPLTKEISELTQEMDQTHTSLLEVLTENGNEQNIDIDAALKNFDERFHQSSEHLKTLASKGNLDLNTDGIISSQIEFAQQARDMISSHRTKIQKILQTKKSLADFDTKRLEIASKLIELGRINEEKMSAMEDRARTKIASGDATPADLGAILEDTFGTSYPVIRGTYAMMRFMMEAQDDARTYVTTTDTEKLAATEKSFKKAIKNATKRLNRIKGRVTDDEGEAKIAFIKNGFSLISDSAIKDGGLFPIYKESLDANASAERLKQALLTTSKDFKLQLASIAEIVSQLNETSKSNASSATTQAKVSVSIIVLSGAIIGLLLGIYLIRSITKPILRAAALTEQMSIGNFAIDIGNTSKNEIGMMIAALGVMRDRISATLREVQESAATLASTSEQTSVITEKTLRSAEEQHSTMEQAATATNEMSASVREVANNTSRASDAAQQVSSDVSTGRVIVQETIDSINTLASEVTSAGDVIQKLAEHSNTIGSVLNVIRGIAEQTNLLALNAAIEAARAGDQGRGFAVVADEVRTLAQRTNDSTQEIEQMIGQLQSGSTKAVEVMESGRNKAELSVQSAAKAGESLHAISDSTNIIMEMNTQIASSAEEQNAVAEDINRNISNISQMVEQTAEGSREVAQGSESVAQQAIQLQNLMAKFQLPKAS